MSFCHCMVDSNAFSSKTILSFCIKLMAWQCISNARNMSRFSLFNSSVLVKYVSGFRKASKFISRNLADLVWLQSPAEKILSSQKPHTSLNYTETSQINFPPWKKWPKTPARAVSDSYCISQNPAKGKTQVSTVSAVAEYMTSQCILPSIFSPFREV